MMASITRTENIKKWVGGKRNISEIIFGDIHISLVHSSGEVYQAVQCLGLTFRRVVRAGPVV